MTDKKELKLGMGAW